MFPFAADAVRNLNQAGLPVIVVTNQSGVARGYFPESLVQEVNQLMKQQLEAESAHIVATYYCPHGTADACNCRKPKTGLLDSAATEHQLDLARSFVVGDRYGDVQLARNAGARSVMVRTGYGEGEILWHSAKWPSQPDYIANDLAAAAEWIVSQSR